MRPPQVSLDFGSPPGTPSRNSSDDFEQIPYPPDHLNWAPSSKQEELPLHYMNEEKARRRVRGTGGSGDFPGGVVGHDMGMEYDDESKDVYAKLRPAKGRVGSGRLRRPPPPPPTSIVCANPFIVGILLIILLSRRSSSSKISNTFLLLYIPCCHVGPASTRLDVLAS